MSGQAIIAPLVAGGDTGVGTEVDEVDDVDDVDPGTGSGGVLGAGVGSGVGVGDGSGKVTVSMICSRIVEQLQRCPHFVRPVAYRRHRWVDLVGEDRHTAARRHQVG